MSFRYTRTGPAICHHCREHLGSESETIEGQVVGVNAAEVSEVAKSVLGTVKETSKVVGNLRRSPWVSGSFYMAAFIIVGIVIMAASRLVPALLVPVVIIGTILGASVLGAFQLRQDASLSEKNFLQLMGMVFSYVPLIGQRKAKTQPKRSAK
jgi:hypothetical protein